MRYGTAQEQKAAAVPQGRPAAGVPGAQIECFTVQLLLQQVDDVHHAKQLLFLFTTGDNHAGVLVFIQQGANVLLRCRQVDMLDVMP